MTSNYIYGLYKYGFFDQTDVSNAMYPPSSVFMKSGSNGEIFIGGGAYEYSTAYVGSSIAIFETEAYIVGTHMSINLGGFDPYSYLR